MIGLDAAGRLGRADRRRRPRLPRPSGSPPTIPNFPWTGILFGAPILGVWYWCTDQFIVQRVLSAAKNIDEARRGTIFAGFLKLLPLFLFVIPGVIAYALAQSAAS